LDLVGLASHFFQAEYSLLFACCVLFDWQKLSIKQSFVGMKLKRIGVLNGPNLNRLGKREPEIYGHTTLEDIITDLKASADANDAEILDFQSNHEGDLVDQIHAWSDAGLQWGIINPGAYTHTSVAIRDALASSPIKFIEVHISNVHERESFRHISLTACECIAQICGFGTRGYNFAFQRIIELAK